MQVPLGVLSSFPEQKAPMALASLCPLWYMVRMAPGPGEGDIPDVIGGHQEDLARLGQGMGLPRL